MGLRRAFFSHIALYIIRRSPSERDMALEDAFASHAAKPEAISAPIGKSSDPAVREGGQELKTKVFISYSRKDVAFADRLEAALKARGFEPLIDRTDIYAFEEWWKRVAVLITRADTVVFVLSPDAVRPGTVALKEIEFAASLNKRFAPIVFRPVEDKLLPEALAKLNLIFFDNEARFEQSADRLAEALNTDIVWIRQHTEFGEQARRWALANRPSGLLLRSPVLEQAEYWIASRPRDAPAPTDETRAYISQSRQTADREKVRARRVRGFIYGLLVSIILGLIGWINQAYIKDQWRWYMTVRPFATANIWPYVLKPEEERALKPLAQFRECTKGCPEMIVVPPGRFVMGSPESEQGRYSNEGPQHEVVFANPFAVARFELTFEEWDTCVAYGDCDPNITDNNWGRGQQPVIYVNWEHTQRYLKWLSAMTGKPYRLLSEAEWEYAARAGTQTAYSWGQEIGAGYASCNGCGSKWDRKQTAPVGSFAPNAFGLHDMHGNVYEWTEDCRHDSYDGAPTDGSAWTSSGDCSRRVARGGSWNSLPDELRAAFRAGVEAEYHTAVIGIRVGRTLAR
jgi:formylglycine-generating enzyme required for sulfatase activity